MAINRKPKQTNPPAIAATTVGRIQHAAACDKSRTGQGGDGVKIGAQHSRDLGQEYIAGHAAADPGQHPEKRRNDRVEPEGERLLRAGNREEGQPNSVEQEHRAAQPADQGGPEKGDGTGKSETAT